MLNYDLTTVSLRQIDCFGKAKNVADILCSNHSITATGTGGLGCDFMPTETGSISRSPDTFHIRTTDTAADTAGSPGPARAAPDRQLIRSLIPWVSAMEIPGLILVISVSQKLTLK
jgi:hypothetical protein